LLRTQPASPLSAERRRRLLPPDAQVWISFVSDGILLVVLKKRLLLARMQPVEICWRHALA